MPVYIIFEGARRFKNWGNVKLKCWRICGKFCLIKEPEIKTPENLFFPYKNVSLEEQGSWVESKKSCMSYKI